MSRYTTLSNLGFFAERKKEHYSGMQPEHFDFSGYNVQDKSDLSPEELKEHLKSIPNAVVLFYAPWCGHCVNAKEPFAKASNDASIPFIAYNADRTSSILQRDYQVKGFPTITRIEHGKLVEQFGEPRTKAGFLAFAK